MNIYAKDTVFPDIILEEVDKPVMLKVVGALS
jgi:hypothetical protein